VNRQALLPRFVLLVLVALLALPAVESASPVEAKRRSRTVTRTFRNAAPIALPLATSYPASATLYPSEIAVKGVKGAIRDVNVRLNDISHDDPEDLQLLLVGPDGQTATVMASIGGEEAVTDVTVRLDDEAREPLTNAMLQSGTFRPTNEDGNIAFNAPAPPLTSANAALSVFDGADPNGEWQLFIQDDVQPSAPGVFAGGWALEITTKAKNKKRKKR
jgi:subtilisin-like proprotein convertase family protein